MPGKAVGYADVSCLACFYDAVKSVEDIVKRRVPVPHVIDVQIHIVHAQIFKAGVDHVLYVLLPGDARLYLLRSTRKKFGRNDYLVTLGIITQRSSNELLTGATLVGNSCVVEIHTQIKSSLNDLSRMFLIYSPAVLAPLSIAKPHASHADAGYVKI